MTDVSLHAEGTAQVLDGRADGDDLQRVFLTEFLADCCQQRIHVHIVVTESHPVHGGLMRVRPCLEIHQSHAFARMFPDILDQLSQAGIDGLPAACLRALGLETDDIPALILQRLDQADALPFNAFSPDDLAV